MPSVSSAGTQGAARGTLNRKWFIGRRSAIERSVSELLFASAMVDGVDVRFTYDFRFEDGRDVHAIGLNSHRIGLYVYTT